MNTPQNHSAQTEQAQIAELQALVTQINYWSDAVIDNPDSRSTIAILAEEAENLLSHLKLMSERLLDARRLKAVAGGAK